MNRPDFRKANAVGEPERHWTKPKSNDNSWAALFLVVASLWFFSAGVEDIVEAFGHPLPDWTSFKIFKTVLNAVVAGVLLRVVFARPRS